MCMYVPCILEKMVSPGGSVVEKKKICLPMQETQEMRVQTLGQEDPLEKEMATHSSTPAWRIPWAEDPARPQSLGSQRVKQDSN